MSRFPIRFAVYGLGLALLAAVSIGCEPQFDDNSCDSTDECFPDERCIFNECVVTDDDYQHETNECGGSAQLDGELREPCGPCELDRLQCADGDDELVCGGETECPDLDVITKLPTDVGATSATLRGEIRAFPEEGSYSELGFCWSSDGAPELGGDCQDVDDIPEETNDFELDVYHLEEDTEYRATAYFQIDDEDESLTNEIEFETGTLSE